MSVRDCGRNGRDGARAAATELLAGGEWPDSPNKPWFENLQRPDNDKNPHRQAHPKSLFCCGVADTVKTKFKVEEGNERYPKDRWYAWLKNDWVLIPPGKIVQDYAPDGQPYLPAGRHDPVLCKAERRALSDR